MNYNSKIPHRFYSLDVLRGLAAITVVFSHWWVFYCVGTVRQSLSYSKFPLPKWFHFADIKGWMAVDLFFCLSGFIFYWLYSERVAKEIISISEFAVLRLSRLYPLHIATLIFVTIIQLISMKLTGNFLVSSLIDSKHFLLNFFFIFHPISSFNIPSWSVSLEIFMYVIFFYYCRVFPIKTGIPFLIAFIGLFADQYNGNYLARGFGEFFLGNTIFMTYKKIIYSRYAWKITLLLALLMITNWVVILLANLNELDLTAFFKHHFSIALFSNTFLVKKLSIILNLWPFVVLFPLTILSLALIETHTGSFGSKFSFLGNISYSIYMLHFPLQLLTIFLTIHFSLCKTVFYTPLFITGFFIFLIFLSLGSYLYFETPAQRFLRRISQKLI